MPLIENFPSWSILLSLLCAVLTSVLKSRAARRVTLLLVTVTAAMSACTLGYAVQLGESVTYRMGHFDAPWGNEIRFGVLEPLLALVLDCSLLLCLLGGGKDLNQDIRQSKLPIYYVMADLIQAALFALIYTNDLFTGYVFIEIMTIASCGILMIRQIGRTTIAATRYMIFSLLGSGLFLLGVILLYDVTGHLLMPNMQTAIQAHFATGEARVPLLTTISLISVGLAIKSGLFPFHFWMPDTYGCATPSSSGILSGLVSKGYIILLIKIISRVIGADVYYASGAQYILFTFGVVGMIVGSLSAIRENDIDRMVAYSSAAQIGYIYMGIGLSSELGLLAAVFHILFHSITKPALFLSGARLSEASGNSKRFSDLQGAAHRNRVAGVVFAISALSVVGIPSLMGFVSKLLFATAGAASDWRLWPTLIALALSTILNTVYFLRTVIRIYTPALRADLPQVRWRGQLSFAVAGSAYVAANLFFGLQPAALTEWIEQGLRMLS